MKKEFIIWKTNRRNGVKNAFRVCDSEESVKRYFENCGYKFKDWCGIEYDLSYDGPTEREEKKEKQVTSIPLKDINMPGCFVAMFAPTGQKRK